MVLLLFLSIFLSLFEALSPFLFWSSFFLSLSFIQSLLYLQFQSSCLEQKTSVVEMTANESSLWCTTIFVNDTNSSVPKEICSFDNSTIYLQRNDSENVDKVDDDDEMPILIELFWTIVYSLMLLVAIAGNTIVMWIVTGI